MVMLSKVYNVLKVIVFIRQVLNCCDPTRDRFMFICNLNIKKLNSVPDLPIVEYKLAAELPQYWLQKKLVFFSKYQKLKQITKTENVPLARWFTNWICEENPSWLQT